MDSYHFQFERMSNFDLRPLSLPASRLSPAKSTSSIDQYSHHHGKGDSAYSSFSGGSSAPDYSSSFLSDDFNPHSLHYADLKYVKAVYGPSILESDPKSMDQLYRSMEVLAQQHHQSKDDSPRVKDLLVPPTAPPPPPPPPPTAPPTRLNSFRSTRNLEPPQARRSPEGQLADVSSSRPQMANPEVLGPRANPVCGWRFSEHYQRDQLKLDAESKSAALLSRLPRQTSQPENSQQAKGSQSDIQQKRSCSAYGVPANEKSPTANPWHTAQNMISGSIQHKGQFYFVTGVYKSSEPSVPPSQHAVEPCGIEAQRQRSHSTIESMFRNDPLRNPSSPDGLNGKLFFQEEKQSSAPNDEPANSHVFNHFCKLDKTPQDVNVLDDSQRVTSMSRPHITNHPVFYCGPETSFSGSDTSQNNATEIDQSIHAREDENINRLTRQTLVDMPSEKISKETTPLLYHLTGANQASFMTKAKNEKNASWRCRDPDWGKHKQKTGKQSLCSTGDASQSEMSKEEKLTDFSYPCNTLDDSFKKYYKEKLKDAQTKVLRETSFKRKDLQLSWPYRIEQRTDKKLSVVTSGSPQDMHSKLESPIQSHLPKFQPTERETVKSQDMEKRMEKDSVKQQNIAQPQVPRVGCRRRLTPEQKKLSHSEPEKLHQLADGPTHMTCRSLGSESEGLLSGDSPGEHGLVATRRKVFETRGRTLSASSLSKTTLKDLQHKALVAYMERKTSQKGAERQQPARQVPSQRHSAGGRESDWGSRPNSASAGPKKKLLRPLSAGRILDSSSTYIQFASAQPSGQSWQSCQKEGLPPPPSGKSASVESLLDAPEHRRSSRSRSTSTPHAVHQINRHFRSSSVHNQDVSSTQYRVEDTAVFMHHAASVPDQRPARVMSSRGKSMEELGVSKVARPAVLSKSSEQLYDLPSKPVTPRRESRDLSYLVETQKQTLRTPRQEYASGSEKNIQAGPDQHCSMVPSSPSAACVTSPIPVSCLPSCDDEPLVSRRREVRDPSTSTGISEGSLGVSKMKLVPQEQSSAKFEMSPGDLSEVQGCDFGHEVSLSIDATADFSLPVTSPDTDGNKGDGCITSQNVTTGHPRNAQPAPCVKMETAPNILDPDLDSISPHEGDQEKKEMEQKCGPQESEKPVGGGSNTQLQWEVLVQDVVSADQSLARILYPITNRKTALMLMEQLLSEDTLLMEEHYKKKQEQEVIKAEQTNDRPVMTDSDKANNSSVPVDDSVSLTTHTQCNTQADITEKKKQLVTHIEERLRSVEGSRAALQGEDRENGVRGDAVEALVRERCVAAELDRYTQFIGDLERVVSLLLCLSARLARVQNALSTVDESTDVEEKQSLANRHQLLCKQREDAKDLKENLDRRERVVSGFLAKQLSGGQLQEYRRFVQTKASLLIRHKELDEKQRLGEEQLEALLNSIPL